MKELNFSTAKTKEEFKVNYKLHDLAEYHGKNLFTQWGIEFEEFGEDNRNQKVWENGDDKPDIIAVFNNIRFFVDWKSKTKDNFWLNKRAVESYINWSKKLNLEAVICFFIFDKNNQLKDRRFALLSKHNYIVMANKAWDKNDVVQFEVNLPKLTKDNLFTELKNIK